MISEPKIFFRLCKQTTLGLLVCSSTLSFSNANDITSNLIAHYPLDGNASDISGNNLHGNVSGAIPTQDRFGQAGMAYWFDGVDDFIRVNHSSILNLSPNLTLSIWFSHGNQTPSRYEDLIMKGNSSFGFQYSANGDRILFQMRGGGSYKMVIPDSMSLSNQTWYHLVGTRDTAVQSLYLNGVLLKQNHWAGNFSNNTNDLLFGYKIASDNNWYFGALDNTRLYNRALNGNEVLALYNLENTPPNTTPSDLNSTAPLAFSENQPVGTVVGEFNATDPDANAILTYWLVSGPGDGNNSLFTLETNGTLKTATTFDFESNASAYSIRVQAKDEHNASVEGNFTVSLTDLYEPSQPNHIVDLNSTVNLEMIWVEPGTFSMGQSNISGASPVHQVTLTKGFYLGKYEVTQAQYEAIMKGNAVGLSSAPSTFGGNPNQPVERVSYNDLQVFLQRLNDQEAHNLPAGWKYVLPTEAQWEYACRAGSTTVYSWGNTLAADNANWNHGSDPNQTIDVGQYTPNAWGFHDMHGNVYEWTADWHAPYTSNAKTDPEGPASAAGRSNRGGSWTFDGTHLPLARRFSNLPTDRFNYIGFRLAYRQITMPPSDLNSTAALAFSENQPTGTVVGEFNATDPDLNRRFTQDLGTKVWEFETGGAIWSKPALASNGMVFFGSKDNKFYALDSETGAELWKFTGSHPFCKPAVGQNGRVYVGTENGKIYSFNFQGNKLWEFATGNKVVASPTLDGNGKLYIGSCDNKFYALNCNDGTKVWEFNAGSQIHTKTVLSKDGKLFFGTAASSNAKLYALDSSDGSKIWEFTVAQKIWSSPALGLDGTVYFGCHDGKIYALDPGDGSLIWTHNAQSAVAGPVTLGYDDSLFAVTSSGKLLALDSKTGTQKWAFITGSSGTRNTPTVASDNSVYFGDINGKLYSINGNDGTKLWDLQVGNGFNVSSPCISPNGKLLIGSQNNKLYCVQASAPLASNAVWPAYGFDNKKTGNRKPHLTYSLVSGPGDGNNSLFTLETNGTLKTATTFDFESNASTYSIRVQAKDELNATAEGSFTVSLTDLYEPSQPNHIVDLNSTVNLEMIWVEPGTFTMGSPTSEPNRDPSETEHNVTLTKGFYLGKYEVTQAQYEAVMTGNPEGLNPKPSRYVNNPTRPVEKVKWNNVQIFVARLNAAEQAAGRLPAGWSYVLPTEAQWEYACRAGTTTAYSWGATIASSNANWNHGADPNQTVNVGQFPPNPWGFFDMHGNVWEWTADRYKAVYSTGNPVVDPTGPVSGSDRVMRGGSWGDGGNKLRSAMRQNYSANGRSNYRGFRLAFKQSNNNPTNLNSTATLAFSENQPLGTVVGEFNATDPDAGATLTYSLVSGAGDTHNILFTLDSNGTLNTATTFDYENNASSYSIRVQAKDEFNASVEGNFTVTLTNDLTEDSDGDGFTDGQEIAAGKDPHHPLLFPGTSYIAQNLVGQSFNSQDLRNADFSDANLTGTNFWGANLTGAKFSNADLTKANFRRATVDLANFENATLWESKFTWVDLRNVDLSKMNLSGVWYDDATAWPVGFDPKVHGALGPEIDLRGFDLSTFGSKPFENADLSRANLSGMNLSGRNFFMATLNSIDLSHSVLEDIFLRRASMQDANLTSANLARANLTAVNLNGAILADANLTGAWFDRSTTWPNGFDALAKGAIGPGKDFRGEDLSLYDDNFFTNNQSADFSFANFSSSNLQDNSFTLTNLIEANFSLSNLTNANFRRADLTRANFQGANLTGANLTATKLIGADFSDSNLTSSQFDPDCNLSEVIYNHNTTWPTGFDPVAAGALSRNPPANLTTTAPLAFSENQPIGTIVGEFNATDADAGATLSYHFASGAGDTHNSLFTMDSNGTLKTAITFDFESNASSYSIRVQVKDEFNATAEGNFTVTLRDVFEDADGDGFSDQEEAGAGTLHNDPSSKPGLDYGLVGYWPLDGNASDMSGNGNHGILKNGPNSGTDRNGIAGKAYSFDGVDDWLEIPSSSSLNFSSANGISVQLWVNSEQADQWIPLIRKGYANQSPENGEWEFRLPTGTEGEIQFATISKKLNYNGNLVQAGRWHCFAFSANLITKEVQLFLDGNPVATQVIPELSTFSCNKWIRIGQHTAQNLIQGQVDEVRIYNRALSANDIAALYQLQKPNSSPVFANPASATVPENQTFAIDLNASDPDGDPLSYSIAGGPDQAKFDINTTNGALSFKSAPDYEANASSSGNNIYSVVVQVSDGTLDANQTVTIHVTDVYETPPNTAPIDLNSTAPLTIAENQPVGTFVGQFTANDPDANASLSYRLANGAGSQHNKRFSLHANGTLRTAKVFNYENRTTFKIRVQVADEHNVSIQEAFIVSVIDLVESNATTPDGNGTQVLPIDSNATKPDANATQPGVPVVELFQPIVETGEAKRVQKDSATLRGSLVDNGGARISKRGFLLSERPNPKPGRKNVTRLDANGSKNFQAQAANLKAGKKYYFRAFARNAQGTALGSVESFTTIAGPPSPSWINAQPGAAANWWTSPWFGNFYLNTNGWIRHEQLGWVFPMESPTAGLWLWKRELGWLWTDKEIYPFLYKSSTGGWHYFYGNHEDTLFLYDYSTKRWITLLQK